MALVLRSGRIEHARCAVGASMSNEARVEGSQTGRHVYGVAAFAFGVVALVGHDFDTWQQLRSLWQTPLGAAIVCIAAAAEIGGGLAVQWGRTARQGAIALGVVYLFFALRHVPGHFVTPLSYDPWGNIFEQLSLVSGAVVVFAGASPEASWAPRV